MKSLSVRKRRVSRPCVKVKAPNGYSQPQGKLGGCCWNVVHLPGSFAVQEQGPPGERDTELTLLSAPYVGKDPSLLSQSSLYIYTSLVDRYQLQVQAARLRGNTLISRLLNGEDRGSNCTGIGKGVEIDTLWC